MSIDTLQEYYERQLRSLDEDEVEPLTDEELAELDKDLDNELDDNYIDEDEDFEEEEL